jgi:hypothetical protein
MSNYKKLVERLELDLNETGKLLRLNQGNLSLECNFVRSFFATLEGILFAFRQEVIESKDFKTLFDLPTQAKIKEFEYDKETKSLKSKKKLFKFQVFCENIIYCFSKNQRDKFKYYSF